MLYPSTASRKEAIMQAVSEHRIAESAHSKTQHIQQKTLADLQSGSQIDLWREPDSKYQHGWKGPADFTYEKAKQ